MLARAAKNPPKTEEKPKKRSSARSKRKQTEADVFSLDIGTRTVVGIVSHYENDKFTVKYSVSVPHTKRAMTDGQIEDIDAVAKVAAEVKAELEKQSEIGRASCRERV